MNKYYTPKLEEFHVGFEFEYRPREKNGVISQINNEHTHIKKYEKMAFRVFEEIKSTEELLKIGFYDEPTDLFRVSSFLKHDAIRVRFLTGADMNDLNIDTSRYWVPKTDKSTPNRLYGIVNSDHNPTSYKFIYNTVSRWMLITEGKNTRFAGKIKNKSELKKILDLLNIKP